MLCRNGFFSRHVNTTTFTVISSKGGPVSALFSSPSHKCKGPVSHKLMIEELLGEEGVCVSETKECFRMPSAKCNPECTPFLPHAHILGTVLPTDDMSTVNLYTDVLF